MKEGGECSKGGGNVKAREVEGGRDEKKEKKRKETEKEVERN